MAAIPAAPVAATAATRSDVIPPMANTGTRTALTIARARLHRASAADGLDEVGNTVPATSSQRASMFARLLH
jgi:hypothetical protein